MKGEDVLVPLVWFLSIALIFTIAATHVGFIEKEKENKKLINEVILLKNKIIKGE